MENQIVVWSLYYQVVIAVAGVVVGSVLLMLYVKRKRTWAQGSMPAWIFWSGLASCTSVGFLALWFYFRFTFQQTLAALNP